MTRYAAYHAWWLDVLAEAGIGPMSAQLNQLKEIDSGLWAVGKQAKRLAAKQHDAPDTQEAYVMPAISTDSEQFKHRAVELRGRGQTQLNAIVMAANELGIELKPSYLKYPGSHFDRWRKQGLG
ncbi:hypothetical protein ACHMW6_28895 [Pseudoduganella sp. UC29_106]|uniref:hypothetical protein n=1 Tax=Pseudoduganella sp. UC29_106 TaxID=3374553 RepID=UPI0037584C80